MFAQSVSTASNRKNTLNKFSSSLFGSSLKRKRSLEDEQQEKEKETTRGAVLNEKEKEKEVEKGSGDVTSNGEKPRIKRKKLLNSEGNNLFLNVEESKRIKKMYTTNTVPTDWTMKVRATFRSKTSFAWCSEIGTDVKSKAYQCFLAREGEDENDKLEDANLLNFEKNMFYYTYPSNPLPDYLLNFYQQHFEKSEKNMMDKKICEDWKEKIEEWAVSFDSIFMLYLNNQCNYFYCFFKEFALLCLSPRSTLCNEFQMIMNCSSKKLRETLITKGIPFVMPLFKKQQVATSLEKNQNEGQELQELQEISKKAPGQANFTTRESKLDFQEETTLLFEGKETLLKMVKFFKEYVLKKSSEMPNSQIPVIYSRAPFLNSSLKNIKIETSQILTSNDQSSVQEILHTLALEGPLFPEVVINLCNLFCTTQSEFTVTFIKKKQPGTPYHDTLIFNNSLSLSNTPPTIKTLTFQEGQYKYQPFT